MLHVLTHAIAMAALGAALWGTGRVVLAFVGEVGRLRHLASFCLGLAWWAAALFGLAATGMLSRWGLAAAAMVPAALAVALRRKITWRKTDPGVRERPGLDEALFGGYLGVVLTASFLLAISPQVSWDADVYHLTLPRLYIENGGFRPVSMSIFSNWPLTVELYFAAAMLVDDYMLAKAGHFGFGLLVIYALFVALAERGRRAALLAAALFLANTGVAFELSAAYVELAQAFFLLSGFVFLDRALEERDQPGGFLLLAGICCGLGAASKVTGVLTAGVIGVLWAPRLVSFPALASFAGRFALPIVLLWTPWLIKSFWYTGNPFYPFLYDWFGGPDWSAEMARQHTEWHQSIGMGRAPIDYLLLPLRVTLMGGPTYQNFGGGISPFWLVVVPLAAVLRRRDRLVRRALVTGAVFFGLWSLPSQQARLLIPVLPLFAMAGAVALLDLFKRLEPRWRRAHLFAVAAALVAAAHWPQFVQGTNAAADFALRASGFESAAVPDHMRFVNEHLPEHALVLFVNNGRGFFCHREFLPDVFFYEFSQVADWLGRAGSAEEVGRLLEERGVTHVLMAKPPHAPSLPAAMARRLSDPRATEVIFESSDGWFKLLELR